MASRVVFFDIGETLVESLPRSARRILGAQLKLSEQEVKQAGRLLMTVPARSPSQLSEHLATALPRTSYHELRHALSSLWKMQREAVRPLPDCTETLQALKGWGLRLGTISNTWQPAYDGFCAACPDLLPLLDYTLLSYRIGIKKPSPALFHKALAVCGAPPQDCWMVGDSYELDMEPALKVGMRTIWVFRHPEREKRTLMHLLRGEKARPDWIVETLNEILPILSAETEREAKPWNG